MNRKVALYRAEQLRHQLKDAEQRAQDALVRGDIKSYQSESRVAHRLREPMIRAYREAGVRPHHSDYHLHQ